MIYAAAGAERSLLLVIPTAIFRGMAIIYFYVPTSKQQQQEGGNYTHTHTIEQRYIFCGQAKGKRWKACYDFCVGVGCLI